MYEPRNHHFVSQVLQRKFRDSNNTLYYYNKETKVFDKTNSTKNFLSERDLNSLVGSGGTIDHKTVEDNLNRHFETDFNKYYDIVTSAATTRQISNPNKLTESIQYLIGMGIIGNMRTPQRQEERINSVLGVLRSLFKTHGMDELKAELNKFEQCVDNIKNKVPINYKKIADKTTQLMGETRYAIFLAPKNDFFLLPDCTAVALRAKLEDDLVHDGQVLESGARPIATVIFPINSNIILLAKTAKICPLHRDGIFQLTSEGVHEYNAMLLDEAREIVVCQNEIYLKKFIEKASKI